MNSSRGQSGGITGVLSILIPMLWFIRASSKGISFWLGVDTEGQDYLEGSQYDRLFFTSLMVAGFLILLIRKIDWFRLIKSNFLVFLFFAYMGISIYWSGFPNISMRRWIHTIGDLIMILVIITEINPVESLAKLFSTMSFVLLFISILLIKYNRAMGVAYDRSGEVEMWTGVATHKNTLGQIALMAGLYCLWELVRKKSSLFNKILPVFILTMVGYILHGSGNSTSVTALLTLIIGTLIILLFYIFKNHPQRVFTVMLILVLLGGFYSYVSQFSSEPGGILSVVAGSVGKDPTLTGRTELWNVLIEIGSKHLPFGVGYGSFWIGNIGNNLWEIFTWQPEQGHNGYIDIYVELGIVGLTLLTLMVLRGLRGIRQDLKFNFPYGTLRFTLLLVCLTHNITESSFGRPSHLMWLLFLLSVVNISDYSDVEIKNIQHKT
ncbi:MAG: O-antigen ligase family protein [Fibrobacter sp.]|nr:O-antigen ligase family protein [Fibrobacter sp.]